MILKVLFGVTILNSVFLLQVESEWELRKERNDIRIYTRKVEGYKIQEVKGVTEIEASPERILKVLRDVEGYPEWIHSCVTAEVLQRSGDDKIIFYSVIKVPWPATDRDMVQKMEIEHQQGSIQTHIVSIPELLPEKKGLIRMPVSNGGWKLIDRDNGTTLVEMQFLNDAGGSLPGWLVNMLLTESPFQTMSGLKVQVKKDKYD